jgi:hypothetical protein
MSTRENIKAKFVEYLEAIPGMREVSLKFKTIDQVDTSSMPYSQAISSRHERERVLSGKSADSTWLIDIWLYVADEADLEPWIEKIRAKFAVDRGLGGLLQDIFLLRIETDDTGFAAPRGIAVLTYECTFRETAG